MAITFSKSLIDKYLNFAISKKLLAKLTPKNDNIKNN